MANPSIKTPAAVYGKTAGYICTTTLAEVLANPVGSGKSYKVNVIRATNTTIISRTINVSLFRASTHTYMNYGAIITAGGTLIAQNRDEYIYLEEGDSLYAKADENTAIHLVVSYEVFE